MAEALKPYYVSFLADPMPTAVDHSSPSPGPGGGGADRAGHTSVRSKARITFAWDDGPARADGMVPFFARSINVYFRLQDFVVAISSDYAEGSCAYETTLRHELESHIHSPIKLFLSYRDIVVRRLNATVMPTQHNPTWTRRQDIPRVQTTLEKRVVDAVGDVRRDLLRALEADRTAHDSPDSYRLVYQQCTPDQWARGR